MSKDKICNSCRIFVEGSECPICRNSNFTSDYKGLMFIIDPNNSVVAKELDLNMKGKYAIRTQ